MKAPQAMRNLPPRHCRIENKLHPEWGTFGVAADRGDWYEIYNERGARVLFKDEAEAHWRRVS